MSLAQRASDEVAGPSAPNSAAEMSSQAEREMAAMRSECERSNAAMRAHFPSWVMRVSQTAPSANAATEPARLATENALFSDLIAAVGPRTAFAFEPYRGSLFEQASVRVSAGAKLTHIVG